ncbi:glutaminase A [Natroniella sp. ANB-PHB2]|uniref:glutaminase A n=1 Tax=Natroniella sp. ANB-PHB2 TaxID=3384444 RepID=UPI0038D45494
MEDARDKKELNQILKDTLKNNQDHYKKGELANYIPALTKVDPKAVGISMVDTKGKFYATGEYKKRFTIQSVSKPLTLMLAIMDNGIDSVFDKVGVEPTGDPFNSIIKLTGFAKPYNPMINAGAIAVTSMIKGNDKEDKFSRIIGFFRKLAKNDGLELNQEVYFSEKETGDRNRSLAYYMRDQEIITGNIEEIVDLYFKQCSIEVNCTDIANMAAVLANQGVDPVTKERIIPRKIARIVRTLMTTCGMYDKSGNFAIEVGLAAKSGVGGGIMAEVPERFGIGVYGPALDDKGNSIVGMKVLKELSQKLNLSIF